MEKRLPSQRKRRYEAYLPDGAEPDTCVATSISRALLELNKLESERSHRGSEQEVGYTAPSWISDGIDIEIQQ